MPQPDGIAIVAEPSPEGDDAVALSLGYFESSSEADQKDGLTFRRFVMRRDVAQSLHTMLTDLLAAPNAEAALAHIARFPMVAPVSRPSSNTMKT